jgi:hypothetical protein
MTDHQPPADVSRRIAEALRMLAVFESVGADRYDLTFTGLKQERRGFRRAQTTAQLHQSIPFLVPSASRHHYNLIVRPRATTTTLIQLDDLTFDNLTSIAPAAFLTLRTSGKGVQTWVAVQDAPAGFAARLKQGLRADPTASGATRVAGTANFKEQYAPHYPVVRILATQPGHVVTPTALEAMGVVAPANPIRPPLPLRASHTAPRTHKWPDYQRVLDQSPLGASGNPQRTKADFVWCKIALSWGHSIEDTAARLMELSTKAQENGEKYARTTAEHAEYAARQRNAQPRSPRPK